MLVVDPGHVYELTRLDGVGYEVLTFVKREGEGYPGNIGSHTGTTTQEVLRALIERTKYVNNQIHDSANDVTIQKLRDAIWYLEERAARRHGREFNFDTIDIELQPTCRICNHIGCEGTCRILTREQTIRLGLNRMRIVYPTDAVLAFVEGRDRYWSGENTGDGFEVLLTEPTRKNLMKAEMIGTRINNPKRMKQ